MFRSCRSLLLAVLVVSAGEIGSTAALAAPASSGLELMERFCYDCHGDGMKKGGMSLEDLVAAGPDPHAAAAWEKAWKINRHELMPPADEDQPTTEERRVLGAWISREMLGVDPANPDPGRVTIRRLNRMEYEYTVTDLFGKELRAENTYSVDAAVTSQRLRDLLPPDDKAFGFDNIGDFQTLSPALLEEYFQIAEFIVDNVMSMDGPSFPERVLSVTSGNEGGLDVMRSEAAGEKRTDHEVRFHVDQAGNYEIGLRFALGGWAEYGGGYEFTAELDGQLLLREHLDVGGQKVHLHELDVEISQGDHRLTLVTLARVPDHRGLFQHLELRPKIWLTGPMEPGTARHSASHERIFFKGVPPEDPEARTAYAREILQRVAERAFRRPVDAPALERLVEIAMRNAHFEGGVADALTAVLTSPKFLFRAEQQPQPNDPQAIHPIDEFALASRLSYLIWLSLPDEELRRLAETESLRENLDAQLARMLADPKAARFFEDFPGQWLRTRNVLMTPISRRDEDLNPVRHSMKRETEMLFEHIAREDRDLVELVTADYTFLDRPLAAFYGIEGFEGEGFQKVALSPDSRRGGILTQGSFLVASSNPNRTSPVKRGLFVLENLMAVEPPPPPPNIPALDEAGSAGERPRTVRAQLELHRSEKSCAACHAHFDPLGLVLENYDLIGRWRDEERGEPIQPNETTVSGDTLAGVDDLRTYFSARRDQFYRCVTEKLMTYALGRGLEPADAVTVDHISARLMEGGGRFSILLGELVKSRPFQMRRGDDGKVVEPPRVDVPDLPPPDKRKGRRFRPEEFREAQKNADAEDSEGSDPEAQE